MKQTAQSRTVHPDTNNVPDYILLQDIAQAIYYHTEGHGYDIARVDSHFINSPHIIVTLHNGQTYRLHMTEL